MIAVRIGPPLRMAVVATPDFWNTHGRPRHPRDLLGHACITYRNLGNGSLLPWDFEKDGKELRVQVRGPLACNSSDLGLAAVRAGCGGRLDRTGRCGRRSCHRPAGAGAGRLVPTLSRRLPVPPEPPPGPRAATRADRPSQGIDEATADCCKLRHEVQGSAAHHPAPLYCSRVTKKRQSARTAT